MNLGVGILINILTEMLVALGALVLLGSIVDLLMFPKIVMSFHIPVECRGGRLTTLEASLERCFAF